MKFSDSKPKPISEAVAVKSLWERGLYPSLQLDANQKRIRETLQSNHGQIVLLCGRRVGKSWVITVDAVEFAIKNPNVDICIAAQTQKQVREIYAHHFRKLLKTAPASVIEPKNKKINQQGKVVFANGSVITIAGGEPAHRDSLRGTTKHRIYVDEAGFLNELAELVNDDLAPQLISTQGDIILSSSPPTTTDHPFVEMVRVAQAHGRYHHSTIFDASYLTEAQRTAYLQSRADALGLSLDEYKATVSFRREIMAELIVDTNKQAVPEWTAARERALVKDVPEPQFVDRYVGGDLGFVDGSGLLLGYFHFELNKLVITHEVHVRRKNPTEVATLLKDAESEAWGEHGQWVERVIDGAPMTLDDLNVTHGLTVSAPEKGPNSFHANLGRLRAAIASEQILIHPRCKSLVYQLQTSILNRTRKTFQHSQDGTHSELLAALMYLFPVVNFQSNPIPPGHGLTYEQHDYRRDDIGPTNESERDLLRALSGPFD